MEQLTLQQRCLVRTTAFAVLRNGTQYSEWLRSKRHSDPLYAFLVGGNGCKYYEWCLSNQDEARREDASDLKVQEGDREVDKPGRVPCNRSIEQRRSRSRSRSNSRSRSRSFRRRNSELSPRRRSRSPPHRHRDYRRRSNPRSDRYRKRSPPRERERFDDRRHGKLYAWSSEEESAPKSSVLLKQKLESIKQKLQEDSSVKLGA